jgi:catechol 2,3-dioxygenase-like lactoylglutathione lyase family enzyme
MKLNAFVLFVKDIASARKFYLDTCGFVIEHDFGKNIIFSNGLALWEMPPDHRIAEHNRNKTGSSSSEIYFESETLDEDFRKIKNAGVHILHDIIEEPWGQRTFRFFDPDGHLVEVGETLESLVKNLVNKGMDIGQVSEKTGMHPDLIQKYLDEADLDGF